MSSISAGTRVMLAVLELYLVAKIVLRLRKRYLNVLVLVRYIIYVTCRHGDSF